MKNSAGRVGCYPPRSKAEVDKTLRDLQNSSYPTKTEFNNCFVIHRLNMTNLQIWSTVAGYINNSLHLARKYARIFVRGHYLFRVAHSFPRATLSENCSLLGTDNVQGQISEDIFAPNGGYCLYYPSNLLRNARSFENWGISSDIPQF